MAYLLGLWLVLLLLTTAAMHSIRWAGVSTVPLLAPGQKHGKAEDEGKQDQGDVEGQGGYTRMADDGGGKSGYVALKDQVSMPCHVTQCPLVLPKGSGSS